MSELKRIEGPSRCPYCLQPVILYESAGERVAVACHKDHVLVPTPPNGEEGVVQAVYMLHDCGEHNAFTHDKVPADKRIGVKT